ncbi:LPD1 domain-containing protein [Breznakia pachnodae]|uniref:Large polyvalent protein-associated domain-containing protein n=1 Tax=Breznakia pachnodae TaxID=265178 RepID=A0ABU0E4C4_9FIRM|nr:LPD1 domain-containing protein [Breznakia pachnodae]MDQ0361579.1 hypothetical protein [Breznakia pachnodae]
MLKVFGFKGGEFGNWLNNSDRQYSLNYAFEALLDLSRAIKINPISLSINDSLSIAFGSRGRGNALAHYEPLRRVINLTKMKGAGSLAHEWAHALDDLLGEAFGCNSFASNELNCHKVPNVFNSLIDSLKYVDRYEETNFYANSKLFDKEYSKTDHGYWSSNEELFARAFACYIYDELDGKSDYLCGHANSAKIEDGLEAYPVGEERERINEQFEHLFEILREKEILQQLEGNEGWQERDKLENSQLSLL